jgi:hypothetical protein
MSRASATVASVAHCRKSSPRSAVDSVGAPQTPPPSSSSVQNDPGVDWNSGSRSANGPELAQVGREVAGPLHVHEVGVDREHGRGLADVRVQARLAREVLRRALGGKRLPVREREHTRSLRKRVEELRGGVRQRPRVHVVAVQQDDAAEAGVGERRADVSDERDERVEPQVDEPVRPAVVVGEPEGDRRRDKRVELRSRAPGDLERDVDVRPQRPVVAVVLRGADGHDHPAAAALEVPAHLEVRHLGNEDRAGHYA